MTESLRVTLLSVFAASLFALLAPNIAEAQTDEVRTHDGSYVRGTIVERVEGSHLVLQTVSGDLRRFELSAVAYAGPIQAPVPQPPSAPPSAAPRPQPGPQRGHEVTVTGTMAGLQLQRLAGSATAHVWGYGGRGYARVHAYDALCGAPCTTFLQPGSHMLGVSAPGGDVPGAVPVLVDGPLHLEIDYIGREGIRITGWVIFVAAALGCLAAVSVPLFTENYDDYLLPLGIGLGVLGVGTAVGVPLLAWNDSGIVRVVGQ